MEIKTCEPIIIYTDGSHKKQSLVNKRIKRFKDENVKSDEHIGYGAFCEYNNKIYKLSGVCDDKCFEVYNIEKGTKISNPTAEFIAFTEVLKSLSRASNPGNDFDRVKITFRIDYEGIRKWMCGEWKCKKPYIKNIKEYADRVIQINKFEINFEDVKSHSNEKGNDMADGLAKETLVHNNFDEFKI